MNLLLLGIIASVEGSSSVFDVPDVDFDSNAVYDPPALTSVDFDSNTVYQPFED